MVARNLRALLVESRIVAPHADCPKVQDAYTLRCAPQVLGAVAEAFAYVRTALDVERNSATDNPLIFEGGEAVSGGNFHGEPVAPALDHLCLAGHEIRSFSERRIAKLANGKLSDLARFLTRSQGIDPGMMIPHYVAGSLVSETRNLCLPATAGSIPLGQSGGLQQHALGNGRQAREDRDQSGAGGDDRDALRAQALEFPQLDPGIGVRRGCEFVRSRIDRLVRDCPLGSEMIRLRRRIEDGSLVAWVEQRVPLF